MKAEFRMQVGQHQLMTPQLLQSIRLLQLSSQELEQEVRQALETNVMLENSDEAEAAGDDEVHPEAQANGAIESLGSQAELAAAESSAPALTEAPVSGCDLAASDRVPQAPAGGRPKG